ncbi:MAG: site-specific integrase [Chloroflexota bacterium]
MVKHRLTDQAIYGVMRRRAADAGVARFSPHDCRRTFVGDLLDSGVDLVTVKGMAGHASVQTTARYDRRGEAAKRKASGASCSSLPSTCRPSLRRSRMFLGESPNLLMTSRTYRAVTQTVRRPRTILWLLRFRVQSFRSAVRVAPELRSNPGRSERSAMARPWPSRCERRSEPARRASADARPARARSAACSPRT